MFCLGFSARLFPLRAGNMEWKTLLISFSFLAIQGILLWMVLVLNRRSKKKFTSKKIPKQPKGKHLKFLNDCEILHMEFEYARATATEAIRDRQIMMNYYLIVVGFISAGVIGILSSGNGKKLLGIPLLWVLCGVGWFYRYDVVCRLPIRACGCMPLFTGDEVFTARYQAPSGTAKIRRPALVCRTFVTSTKISCWRNRRPFSTTTMVPSSK